MKYITNSFKEYVSDITLTLTEKCDTFLIRLFTKKGIKDILNSCKVFLTSKNELIIVGKHIIIRGVYFKDATTLKTLYFKPTLIECKNGVDIIYFSNRKQNVTPYGVDNLKFPDEKDFEKKIRVNTDYYPSGSDIFFFYNKDISNKIKNEGITNIENIENEKDKENT